MSFATVQQAKEWFGAEIESMMACAQYASTNGLHDYAWQLPWTFGTFLHRQGRWLDYAATQEIALSAAAQIGDKAILARVHRNVGRPYTLLGNAQRATQHFEQALAFSRELGDRMEEALCLDAFTWLNIMLDNHAAAMPYAQQALVLYRELRNPTGEARALNYLGRNEGTSGNLDAGLRHCEEALRLFTSIGNDVGLADTHDSLGLLYHLAGDHERGIQSYRESARLWHELDDKYNEADVLIRLGSLYKETGARTSARVSWTQALTILQQINHPKASTVESWLERS
jgi:tetratricopeptide (TPR) repeat protein